MNRIHRIVWNATLGVFQVASELARAHGGKSGRSDRRKAGRHTLTYAAAAVVLAAGSPTATAQFTFNGGANPTDYTVDGAGNATVTGSIITTGFTALGVTGTAGTLTNSGTISAHLYGVANQGGNIGTLSNSGTISASGFGISNTRVGGVGGTIGALSNSGTISGITNRGLISLLQNQSSGTIGGGLAVYNLGTIGTLSNSGSIASSGNYAINNGSTIAVLQNLSGGVIKSTGASASAAGVYNTGNIGTLTNSGTISGQNRAIYSTGSIGTLSNSGTIIGQNYAVYNFGTIGTLINAGLIKGDIYNPGASALNLQGGTGSIFGTLTGYTSGSVATVGTFSTGSNINFSSGNILLNDNILPSVYAFNNTGTGVLQVDNPITIGNYNQGSNATLQIGVGSGAVTNGTTSDSGYGRLVVTWTAAVASGSSIRLVGTGAGYGFAAGQRFLVIKGGAGSSYGGVTTQGSVSTLNYSAANYAAASIAGNAVTDGSGLDLVLTLNSASPTSTAGSATAPNAMAAFGGLANYTGLNAQLMNLQNAAAAAKAGSADQANQAGKQLAPSGGAGGAASSATMAGLDVVGARMGGAGSGGYASMDGSGLGTGIATGEATRDWAAWGQAFGGHANQSQRDQIDGYSASYGGILLGIDKDLHNRWRAGGAFSYSNTYVSNSGDTHGNSAHINSYGLIGYARYQGDPWYVNLSATAANQQYSTSRAITSIPGFSGTAQGKFSGMQYAARAEAGYPIPLKNDWVFTPLGSLTYSYQNQNAYTESGGNGAGLSVGSTNANSIKSGLGARLEKSYSTRYGQVVPFIQAQWIHEYNTRAQATTAGFSIDPSSTAFTTYGASPIADMADVALGVTLIKANNLSVSARYEVQAARGFFAQTGFVKLQMTF